MPFILSAIYWRGKPGPVLWCFSTCLLAARAIIRLLIAIISAQWLIWFWSNHLPICKNHRMLILAFYFRSSCMLGMVWSISLNMQIVLLISGRLISVLSFFYTVFNFRNKIKPPSCWLAEIVLGILGSKQKISNPQHAQWFMSVGESNPNDFTDISTKPIALRMRPFPVLQVLTTRISTLHFKDNLPLCLYVDETLTSLTPYMEPHDTHPTSYRMCFLPRAISFVTQTHHI